MLEKCLVINYKKFGMKMRDFGGDLSKNRKNFIKGVRLFGWEEEKEILTDHS